MAHGSAPPELSEGIENDVVRPDMLSLGGLMETGRIAGHAGRLGAAFRGHEDV